MTRKKMDQTGAIPWPGRPGFNAEYDKPQLGQRVPPGVKAGNTGSAAKGALNRGSRAVNLFDHRVLLLRVKIMRLVEGAVEIRLSISAFDDEPFGGAPVKFLQSVNVGFG